MEAVIRVLNISRLNRLSNAKEASTDLDNARGEVDRLDGYIKNNLAEARQIEQAIFKLGGEVVDDKNDARLANA